MKRLYLPLMLVISIVAAQASAQQSPDKDPMARFAPFVGKWSVRHTLWSREGQKADDFQGTANIYFVEHGTVLVVEETDPGNSYRFVGFHTFDAATNKYFNWTASSRAVLAWSDGEWNDSSEVLHTRRLDPKTGQIDPLIGRGVWTIIDRDTHVYRAVRIGPDGTEVPFKEEKYTRIKK